MNERTLHELLAVLGAGAVLAGCTASPPPADRTEPLPAPEVNAAASAPPAADVGEKPAGRAGSPVPVATVPTASATQSERAAPRVAPKNPVPVTAASTATAVVSATPVPPATGAPSAAPKKHGAHATCGEGACG
jgi:hypothetical protein